MGERDAGPGVVGQLSSLKSMAAQVVASSGTPVTSSRGSGLEAVMGLESRPGQQSSEQMRRECKADLLHEHVHYVMSIISV